MNVNKNLTLARQARKEGNTEDAKRFYDLTRIDDPENGEAKFFYAYYSLYEGKNVEIPSRFANLCKIVKPSIDLIKNSSLTKEEQLESLKEIVETFVPETWTINRYMNKKNSENKVGNSYVRVFDANAIKSCGANGMSAIRDLGNELEALYGEDAEGKNLAVVAWKEYVSLSQKWYAWAIKGDAEIYAEKIKKIDPSYVMPEKAGCISFSNKKN